jgi:peptidoglycan hydrolase CwlO-like protein
MEPARKGRVPFFYVTGLFLAVCGIVLASSCAHNALNQPDTKVAPPRPQASVSRDAAEGISSDKDGRKFARKDLDELESELERAQTENTLLREENNWLRTEVNRLQQSLADANEAIYSLTRKLDAIFKPNSPGQ